MFSPRLLAVLAVLAAVSALPASEKPIRQPITSIDDDTENWFSFPLIGNLFAPLWKLFPSFAEIGPRVISDDDKFQVIISVKDYSKDDLKVKVKGDFIFVQGLHETKPDDRDLFASQFFHTYTLPANSSGADVTADLYKDGYLVITAPLNAPVDRTKETDREVAISETGVPYQKEDKEDKATVAPAEEDDKKEPTTSATPADREDATEKDNVIPHGNEP